MGRVHFAHCNLEQANAATIRRGFLRSQRFVPRVQRVSRVSRVPRVLRVLRVPRVGQCVGQCVGRCFGLCVPHDQLWRHLCAQCR